MAERDEDSDAPEELTAQQGIKQDEEIRKIQRENKFRVTREGKERRRQWAQRKTAQPSRGEYVEVSEKDLHHNANVEVSEKDLHHNAHHTEGMLPSDIVNILAAREKQTFHSDSDNETMDNKPPPVKRRQKDSGLGPVLLTDIPPAECLNQSREFLKKRKAHVSRSNSTLKNSNQALRLLSASGLLIKN